MVNEQVIFQGHRIIRVSTENISQHPGGPRVVSKNLGHVHQICSYIHEFPSKFFCKFFGYSTTPRGVLNKILLSETLSILKSANDNP